MPLIPIGPNVASQPLNDNFSYLNERKNDLAFNIKDYGAKGDGVTDDTAAIQERLNYVAGNGGILYFPPGTYNISNTLSLSSASAAFSVVGSGWGNTIIKRATDFGSMFNIGNVNNVILKGFTVAGNHSIFPNGNHGIVVYNSSHVRIREIKVSDYKNTGILVYTTPASNSYENCVVDSCLVDGNNASNNGILIADLVKSGMRNCHVINIGNSGSPGYGLQLKNTVQFGFIENCYVDNAVVGIAFGQDILATAVTDSIVSNCRVYNCTFGIVAGYAERNKISDIILDMNNTGDNAIDFQTGCIGNAITGVVVKNVITAKSCIRLRSGATDNVIDISNVTNTQSLGSSGSGATFDSGSLRNIVKINRISSPTTITNSESLVTDNSTGSTNIFEYIPLPTKQSTIISTDAITLKHSKITRIKVDTEGAAATDDLATINGGVDGQIITIQQVSNVRDVTIKHGTGNIKLNGSIDFTLGAVASTITLVYDSTLSAWCEISRGTAA